MNGFVSEFLIYLGVFKNGITARFASIIPALVVIGSLALIGGLGTGVFYKGIRRNISRPSAEQLRKTGT